MTGKSLVTLPVGPGADSALAASRALADALAGGPALLPVPVEPAAERARITGALRPDRGLTDDETALVVPTSGSTGVPKGVLLTSAALRASAAATHRHLGGPGRWLLALPVLHIAGLQVVTRSLLAGTEPVVLDASTGFRADVFAEAAHRALADGGRCYTALVPTQLARLVDDGGAGLAALRRFDGVLCGGAATPRALLERARAEGVAVRTTYGMSETAGGCVYDGTPLTGVRVRPEAGDAAGPIELAGPMLATGYRLDPERTAESFVDGWFRTGDLGEVDDQGRLRVLGRMDDIINTGGVKIAPVLVEEVLTARPEVAAACVVGLPDPEWGSIVAAAVVPADPTRPPSWDVLRGAVRERLGAAATPRATRTLPTLPLLTSGKVDRRAVRALMGEGSTEEAGGTARGA